MSARAALIALLLTSPSVAQEAADPLFVTIEDGEGFEDSSATISDVAGGTGDDPLFVGIEDGVAIEDSIFSDLVSDQQGDEDDFFIDVTEEADPEATATITVSDVEMFPINRLIAARAPRVDIMDRCAAFASSLYTVTAGEQMGGTASTRYRNAFTTYFREGIALRLAAGMEQDEAEEEARRVVLPLARDYITIWQTARQRTGSYFSSPLRRLDQLACAQIIETEAGEEADIVPAQPRPSISEQIDGTSVGRFGQDN